MSRGCFDPPGASSFEDTTARASIPGRSSADVFALSSAAGGADRARTGDPLVANQVLSQLSYSPGFVRMVGLSGFEPLTSRLSAVRSSQLSYRPVVRRLGPRGSRGRMDLEGQTPKERSPGPGAERVAR